MDQQESHQKYRRSHPVHRHIVVQVDEPEQVPARHLLDAVLTAGKRCLQTEEVDHLRQRQSDHGEVDAGAADRQIAQHQAQHRAGQAAQYDGDGGVHVPGLHRPGCNVAAHTEEGCLAEGQKPDVADHQVEGGGKQRCR